MRTGNSQSAPEHVSATPSSVNLVLTVTVNGQILYISSNCEDVLGYTKDMLIGTSIKNIIHKDDRFMLESYFFNKQQQSACALRVLKTNNDIIWFETIVEPIFDTTSCEYEEILLKMNVLVDPANDRILEENSPNTLLSSLFPDKTFPITRLVDAPILIDEAPFPIIIAKLGQIVYFNREAASLLEIQHPDEVSGNTIYQFIDEEFHEVVGKRIEQLQSGFRLGIIEQRWKKQNSEKIYVEVKEVPIYIHDEIYEYIVLHDISSRKSFHDIIHRSRERYQRIIQNSIDTIAVIYQNNWVFINDSGVKMFGANSYTEMLGKNIYTFLHPDNHDQVREFIGIVNSEKKEVNFSKQSWYTFQGKQIYTELIGIPTTYFGEAAVQVIIRDISDRIKAEELMIKSEKLSIAGQLAAGIAHEIRNPLTAIKGFLQLFNDEFQGKQNYFDIIFSELNRIELILSELLLLAKPSEIKFKNKDIRIILRDVVTLLETQAILQNIQINIDFVNEDSIITCDENQIKQVFINLIKNSIDAMENGGTIIIRTRVTNDSIYILFIDEGCGIPKSILDRIGEPFYTTKEKGTGLGLMVSYNIIENHNGEITVDSKENEGTTFKIKLPRINETV
ncbi:PAS domain S-box protein [Fredinandcohnia sp. QZ13]|uniref:PAS domain S-box protein n=1 Tax=Fredinandcohnia sp. QZ13 TaxID=3073144 RepID=UPI00285356BB|nr:PAS domain S-box protein [Fredinandcohnia sp. QZ13]MDR4886684.1 PAS domain S-box protein [Fredinandcohnia sp. QZ13]